MIRTGDRGVARATESSTDLEPPTMSDIPPIHGSHAPIGRIGPGSRLPGGAASHARQPGADEAQFSPAARLLGQLHGLPPVRAELITAARDRIDSGFYDNEQVTDQTLEALVAEEF